MATKRNTSMQKKLELQLHEQYAQNNNSYFNTIVVFMCTLIAVIAAYGYVALRTNISFSRDFGNMVLSDGSFTLEAFVLTAMASLVVLAVCFVICVYQGVAQRNEQFIIDAIRRKYYGKSLTNKPKIFPESYHPYYKEGFDIIQGHYGLLINIILFVAGVIMLMTFVKLFLFCPITKVPSQILFNIILWRFWFLIFIVSVVIICCLCVYFYNLQIKKYHRRQGEFYLSVKPDLDEDRLTFVEIYCDLCHINNQEKTTKKDCKIIKKIKAYFKIFKFIKQ